MHQSSANPRLLIEQVLVAAFKEAGAGDTTGLLLEKPLDSNHGDLACAFSLRAFKQLSDEHKKKYGSPRGLAEYVAQKAQVALQTNVGLEVAGPGFINCTYTQAVLWRTAVEYARGEAVVSPHAVGNNGFQVVEYVSPNTNKPLHIGHLRNAAIGVALANILERQGSAVARSIIFNDRGLHIMKSTWAYVVGGQRSDLLAEWQVLEGEKVAVATFLQKQPVSLEWQDKLAEWVAAPEKWLVPTEMLNERLTKPDHFIGFWYQVADLCADEPKVAEVWAQMLQVWEDASHPAYGNLRALWKQMNEWFYQGFNQTKAEYGFSFDPQGINYESAIYQAGKTIVQQAAEAGTFVRLPDGAVKADLSSYNLPDKVLLRKDGTGIYMTFDIELTRQRTQLGANHLFWVVGADQTLYFKQLFAVAEQLGFGQRDRYTHIAHGMVRLPEGKMSSRKGLVIYADDLLDSAVEKAKQLMLDTNLKKELSEPEFEAVAQQVGIGAVKWTMLSVDTVSDITFDIDDSVSFKGFAGPYVQYAHARARSILAKALEKNITVPIDTLLNNLIQIDSVGELETSNDQEIDLLRNSITYYETVIHSAQNHSPHFLCTYLHGLCQSFNAFYAANSVLGEDVPESVRNRRLVLVQAVATILKDGLTLLGIEPVEKM